LIRGNTTKSLNVANNDNMISNCKTMHADNEKQTNLMFIECFQLSCEDLITNVFLADLTEEPFCFELTTC
jgi:hypothetical protein